MSPSGVEEREFQRAYQWDARHNAYGPGGVGSNLYFPNGNIPPPPLIVTPEPVPVEHPEPVEMLEFYDLGRGYARDKRGMYGVDLSEAPGTPRQITAKTKLRVGEKAIVSQNNRTSGGFRPREYEYNVPDE